jgi:YbgC/YbaW family acyl-CoA thioester hydrolase
MIYETHIMVRGYEMDSYGHVNNAVYLNYVEQCRWEILQGLNLIELFKKEGLLLVVTESKLRYAQEAKVFDRLLIKTRMLLEGPYIIFKHRILNADTQVKLVTAEVKTLVINEARIPCSVPNEFKSLFETTE